MGLPDEDPVRVTVPQIIASFRCAASVARCSSVLLGLIEKILLFEEIAGRVAGEGELRENGYFRSGFRGTLGEGEDALGVAIEVADGGVGLREGNFHARTLLYDAGAGRRLEAFFGPRMTPPHTG